MIGNKSILNLEAEKILNLPAKIDTDLGSSSWRTGGSAGVNVRAVTDLTSLQAVLTGEIASIQDDIDLVNTNVVLPNDVYLRDDGGSIVTSGTGELKLQGNSWLDNSILNASLNWDDTSTANLIYPVTTFSVEKYPIDETISTSISFSDVDAGITSAAQTNIDNINKAITDTKLFNGVELYIPKLDCFINNVKPENDDWYSFNLVNQHEFSIKLPSDFTLRMTDDVYLRSMPSNVYAQNIISSLETKNVSVIGGNLIGSRLVHNYRQYRSFYSPSSGSEIIYVIGENDAIATQEKDDWDGVETDFVTSGNITSSHRLTKEGVLQVEGVDYTYSGDTFTFTSAPAANDEVIYYPYRLTITITPDSEPDQAKEISDAINAATDLVALGYSSTYVQDGNQSYFTVSNNTDGLYFRVYGSTANGYSEYLSGYDITYELGVAFIGVIGGVVNGCYISDCYGDGIVAAGNGLATGPNFINSENIWVHQCVIHNNRRNNISPIGVDTMVIERNRITWAGQDMGANLGSAPRLGVDTEPTRYRNVTTGEVDDTNIVRNVIIRNNFMLDNLFGSINLFSSYECWAVNNLVNTRLAGQKLQGGGICHNIVNFNWTAGGAKHVIGQRAFHTSYSPDPYTTKVEIASEVDISYNKVYGTGKGIETEESGARLEGWKINFTHNTFKNINNSAIVIYGLRDSNISFNTVESESDNTNSKGISFISTAVRDVFMRGNHVRTNQNPLEISSTNTDTRATEVGLQLGDPSLTISDDTYESLSDGIDDLILIKNSERIKIFRTHFKSRVYIRGLANSIIDNCDFDDRFYNNGSGNPLNNNVITNNRIKSLSTNPALELTINSASSNTYFGYNKIWQESNGARAIHLNNGGVQADNFTFVGNELIVGSPTEFITAQADNSLFKDNYDNVSRSAVNQTITGTNNDIV